MTIPDPSAIDRRRRDARDCLLTFLVVFGNYLISAPRGVMLDDDGYFIMAAWFYGVAHPPGYPLYTLLAHLATWLPFGSVAWRVHLFSALCGALASVFVWKLARLLLGARPYAWTAALSFAFSMTFWSQSIIAEVYSLNMLFLFALLLLGMEYSQAPHPGDRRPLLIAFLYGLSLTNHWPLMGLCTPALAAVLWPQWRMLLRQLPALALCTLAGLLPYVWMVLSSQLSEISFYGPIHGWSDFWFYVSRQGYSTVDHSPTAGWWDKGQFAEFALRETVRQFGALGVPFLLLGFLRQWRVWPLRVCLALLLAYVSCTFLLVILLDFDFDLLSRNVFMVYPLPAYGAAALWLALGLREAVEWVCARPRLPVRRGFLQCGAILLLVLSVWIGNAPANLRARDNWAADYAAVMLLTLPENAVLFVSGDYTVGPVGYLNRVEGLRPDVTLFSINGLIFSNRLYKPSPRRPPNMESAIDEFIRATDRRVFYFPSMPHRYGNAFYGLYFEVMEDRAATLNRVVATPQVLDYFQHMLSRGEPRDTSELIQYRYLKGLYCSLVASVADRPANGMDKRSPPLGLSPLCNDYYGLMHWAEVSVVKKAPDQDAVRKLLRMAERHIAEVVQVRDLATLYHLYGRSHELSGNSSEAAAYYRQSMKFLPTVDNPSYALLMKLMQPGSGG